MCAAGPRPAGWPPYLPYPPTYLKDPLPPAHGLANPHVPRPNDRPESGLHAGTSLCCFVSKGRWPQVGEATSCLARPAPSSLFILKPQEHGHTGLPKAQAPDTIHLKLSNQTT